MQSALTHIRSELKGLYPETEINSFGLLIIEHLTGFSRTEILLNKNTIFSTVQHQKLNAIIQKLKNFVPIQYILGMTEFYGLNFLVNDAVLIPRPETEELVDWIYQDHKALENLHLLDIGTGSGCIAIALQSVLNNAFADAFDLSETAIAVAEENAKLNHQKVNFSKVDILNPAKIAKKWDIIVSNPPYIPVREKCDIQPNVLNHEPHLALFVPDHDPLIFYRQIALFAKEHLQANGKLYFEIHRDFGVQCKNLLAELEFTHLELRKDISGNDRMLKAEISEMSKLMKSQRPN